MDQPNKYKKGQEHLIKLGKVFNKASFENKLGVNMYIPAKEDGGVDGRFEDKRSRQMITFEFEYRWSGIKRIGQYERKLYPRPFKGKTHDRADLQVMMSTDGATLFVVYHSVYDMEPVEVEQQPSDRYGVEDVELRYTTNFQEFKVSEITKFLEFLRGRFD